MATSGARKSKRSKKSAARPAAKAARAARPTRPAKPAPAAKAAGPGKPAGAGKLRELIGEIIEAQNRGDQQLRDAAVRALEKFESHAGSTEVRQRAVEARAAAGHAVAVDSARLLGEIVQRLDG